ncbi:hypothetical protein ACGFYP_03840 [Streptomyces sp. NPDC048370]|uniref:hypothetical protein n=1 Tax=Streptomyces sp. NPDC048370 TaxID=3365540 RepID=UPI00371CC049
MSCPVAAPFPLGPPTHCTRTEPARVRLLSGFEDLEHWLSCGDLANASAVMTATLTQLLDQLPETGDHVAIEEVLADQASELVERTRDFAAGLIRREPLAADAKRIASLAARMVQTAGEVDERRSH